MQGREVKHVTQEGNVEHKTKEEERAAEDPPQSADSGTAEVDRIVRDHERLAKISPRLAMTSVVKLRADGVPRACQPSRAER